MAWDDGLWKAAGAVGSDSHPLAMDCCRALHRLAATEIPYSVHDMPEFAVFEKMLHGVGLTMERSFGRSRGG